MRFVPLLLFVCSFPVAAAETAERRAARVYADGLERPLLQLRAGARLVEACAQRMRKACSRQQRELAATNRTTALIDALSLFPQRLTEDPAAGISRPAELRQKISETSAALLREAGEYDRKLFARYGATLHACPYEDDSLHRASMEELKLAAYSGFLGMTAEQLSQALDATHQDELRLAETLRTAPREDCLAARRLGEYLMQLMHSKLQPWTGKDEHVADRAPAFEFGKREEAKVVELADRELAQAVAGNFVSVIATELQLTVFPESESRIKEIADAIETARQDQ